MSRFLGAAVVLTLIGTACAEPERAEPALQVGSVAFAEEDLGVLGPAQRQQLGALTAFALAVREHRIDELAQPFIARERRTLLLRRLAAEVAAEQAGLDEADLRSAYLRDPEHELVVRHIVILSERWRPEEHRREARRRAERALERARTDEPFSELAAELSEEPGAAERGGLLQPGRRGSWVPEFWRAASALDEGEISGVVETEYGFHVLKLEERRTVPFEEVRDRVLPRLPEVRAASDRARAWAAAAASAIALDTAALRGWRSGTAPDSVTLARWPGGDLTGAEFRAYLLTLDPETRTRVEAAPMDAYRGVVRSEARNVLLAQEARDRGMRVPEDELAVAEREWTDRARGWARALGFSPDASDAELRTAALAALDPASQDARIARSEVLSFAQALSRMYPIRMTEPQPVSAEAG